MIEVCPRSGWLEVTDRRSFNSKIEPEIRFVQGDEIKPVECIIGIGTPL